jgi:FkbM family methyltransferase
VFVPFLLAGCWNSGLIQLLRSRLKQRGTYMDVGANIGLTLVPVAHSAQTICIGLEPDPSNYRYLARNCFGHDNISLHNMALFDKPGVMEFELSGYNYGDHRMHRSRANGAFSEQDRSVIQVNTARLDDLISSSIKRPLAIKIDTQGAEPFVIAGARRIIAQTDFLVLELWPYGINRLQGDFGVIRQESRVKRI